MRRALFNFNTFTVFAFIINGLPFSHWVLIYYYDKSITEMSHRVIILFVAIILQVIGSPSMAAPVTPPNIILILADDLGYGDAGAYGADLIDTPHLDRLAADGIRLTNFYASGNVCTPSRAGLLTGRYAIRDGLADGTITLQDTRGLPAATTTIAGLLQQHGYRTALIGKWHLGHHVQAQRPNAHGFDEFYGLLHPNDAARFLYRNTQATTEPFEQSTLTRRFTGEAVKFIERNSHQPFFLFMSHTAPHIPLVASPAFAGTSRAGTYGDVVQELDWSVGQVLNAVQRYNLTDNTAIIFTSDNGPFPEGSTGNLRGGKGTAWDGGYRVPFIARWPGHIGADSITDAMAMNIDLLPTITAITGATLSHSVKIDGRNILPVLLGDMDASPHKVLYFFNNERIAALRTQDWKIVVQAGYRDIQRRLPEHDVLLLFDMRVDPQERYSLAAHRADKWQELQALLELGQQEIEVLAIRPGK